MSEDIFPFFNSAAVLLAFIIAFYGLIAQWKKAPYIVNSTYALVKNGMRILIGALLFAFIFEIIKVCQLYSTHTHPYSWDVFWNVVLGKSRHSEGLFKTSSHFVTLLVCILIYRVLGRDYNKYYLFRTGKRKISSSITMRFKGWIFYTKPKGKANKPQINKVDASFLKKVMQDYFLMKPHDDWKFIDSVVANNYSLSILCENKDRQRMNSDMYSLALSFIEDGHTVIYTCCDRHPIEFMNGLKQQFYEKYTSGTARHPMISYMDHWGDVSDYWDGIKLNKRGKLINANERIILVDAHSKHFGFEEVIYKDKTYELEDSKIKIITADTSFAGLHTAIADAHKAIKISSFPLLIYEDISSLIDIESNEQYKIFMRHVIASERLYGGMFTVFFETNSCMGNSDFVRGLTDKHIKFDKEDIAYHADEISEKLQGIVGDVHKWASEANQNGEEVLFLTIMKGGKILAEDLCSLLKAKDALLFPHIQLQELKLSTYDENGRKLEGPSKIENKHINWNAENILIIDDICHTGSTLKAISEYIKWQRGANPATQGRKLDLRSLVAIHRNNDGFYQQAGFQGAWYLFNYFEKYANLPDAWMYGYGMDNNDNEDSRKSPHFIFSRRYGI
jgi:hypoxanthine-guanine phosphoribosyltransferase